MPQAQELMAYWAEFPPVHLGLKALMGSFGRELGTKPEETAEAVMTEEVRERLRKAPSTPEEWLNAVAEKKRKKANAGR